MNELRYFKDFEPEKISSAQVGVVMGSETDFECLKHSVEILRNFKVTYEVFIVSAHRTPGRLYEYGKLAQKRGLSVIIAGAGGAAHLPGMLSALTILPVLGVPVESKTLKGVDSLYSIVQMPAGIPTATFAIGSAGAKNAALFALQILSIRNNKLMQEILNYREFLSAEALKNQSETFKGYLCDYLPNCVSEDL
jgi:5-(carboxyamino)imidazole ribonucleotide mutase